MCLLNSFGCCLSLSTGMHFISFSYIGFFSFIALNGMKPLVQTYGQINWIEWYVYGGLIAGICGLIGLRWQKKAFVMVLLSYDTCLSLARAGLIYMYYNYPKNMNIITNQDSATTQTSLLIWQLYFIWVEYSYLRSEETPPSIFVPLPQNVVTHHQVYVGPVVGTASAPTANELPSEYQRQFPHAYVPEAGVYAPTTAPIMQPAYPHYPPLNPYPYNNCPTVSGGAQPQPFPYDAPPPYSESKQPTAPSA